MSTTKSYQSIPDNFLLRQVIVIHRHGDRAQLSRSLGNNYPENPQVTEKWKTVLPTEDNIKRMFLSAKTKSFEDSSTFDLTASVYDGRDNNLSPYSQLTDIGVQQMVQVGEQLRQRYSEEFLPKDMNAAAEKVYLRSTNMCRTLQSLRSLLSGLFSITTESDDFQKRVKALEHQDDRLAIEVLPNTEETMYPQADGPCAAMVERRKIIFPPDLAARTINGYNEIEKKIRNVLGFTDRIDWMTSKEVLTCHTYHGIDYIKGLNSTDIEKVTEIAGWTWGVLYKVS